MDNTMQSLMKLFKDLRPNSIKHLHEMLQNVVALKDKISLSQSESKLTILFADRYKFDVILKGNFVVSINDIFAFEIEEQDIVDVLIDLTENDHYVVERKKIAASCKKFEFLSKSDFNKSKDKWLKAKNIKIFNREKIIANN